MSDSPNLVSSWRQVVTNNGEKELKAALDKMNGALDTSYRHDRIKEFEKGTRRPNPDVIDYMLQITLPALAKELGLNETEAQYLAKKCKLAGKK